MDQNVLEEKKDNSIEFSSSYHSHNKIILHLMIRNESKIIERCLQHAIEYVDAVCILDTGSTDNTIDVCRKFLSRTTKPFKISEEPFKNFGHNRTVSFRKCQQLCKKLKWNPEITYTMTIDADMIIKPQSSFKDFKLTHNGYNAIQDNGNIKYYNIRFMKCSYDWKCIGSTHEYWSGDPHEKIPYEVFYIDDKNDGGCKSDKFERDLRLLTEEVKENPKNDRAHYYLGQSLKDLGRFEEAIEMFKKRISLGGWIEEVWYSHYQIGRCYDHLKDEHQMEFWLNKAFQYHPKRAEPLYHLTKYFRIYSQHHKAYHYYLKGKDIPFPKDDLLFIEEGVYKGLFDYENTILACYVNGKTKWDSLCDTISYINRNIPFFLHNVYDNIVFYADPLTDLLYNGVYTKYLFPVYEEIDKVNSKSLPENPSSSEVDPKEAIPNSSNILPPTSTSNKTIYLVSSCSIVPYSNNNNNKKYLLNTRYVNYTIDSRGCYHMSSADGNIKTKNGMIYLNEHFQPTDKLQVMKEEIVTYPSNIEGLEDLRLFYHQDKLKFTASSKNITMDGKIVIAYGDYDEHHQLISNVSVLEPPRPSNCEKNWIYVSNKYVREVEKSKNRLNFVFGWHPLQIGSVNDENKLEIHTTYSTPSIFTHFRGSSNIVEYKDKLYCVIHYVKYCTPRNYLHAVVEFNRETMKPERYTPFFYFRKLAIEYCVGFYVQNETMTFIFSENDCDPGMIQVPMNRMRFLQI
jgi:tetratricopeptide (TPR) repeat protein